MEHVPVLDYTPEGLLGIVVALIFFGVLVPYRTVKQYLARIAYLESALAKTQEALAEEQKTGAVVRHFFDGLSRGVDP